MNRRNFLASAGAGAALMTDLVHGQGTGMAAGKPAGSELLLGTVTYNLAKSWDIETIIKNCTETKFLGVELRTTHAHGVEIALPAEKRKEVRARFADSPVKLVGLGTTCEYHSPDPAVLAKNIEETKEWVRLAKDVGAGGVKVRPNGIVPNVPEEKTLEQIGKALKQCAAFASDFGIPIRLEVHGRDTARFSRIRTIMAHADHPNFWICWNCNNEDLLDGGIEANFKMVQARLGLVHLKDLYDEYPYPKFVRLLQGINFGGYCLAEVAESSDPIRVMKYYRGFWRTYQGLS